MNALGPNSSLNTPPLSRNLRWDRGRCVEGPAGVPCHTRHATTARMPAGQQPRACPQQPALPVHLHLRRHAPLVERLEQRLVARQVRQLALRHWDVLASHVRLEVALQGQRQRWRRSGGTQGQGRRGRAARRRLQSPACPWLYPSLMPTIALYTQASSTGPAPTWETSVSSRLRPSVRLPLPLIKA